MFDVLVKIFKTGCLTEKVPLPDKPVIELGSACQKEIARLFGKSLAIRMVDAGSCNGCELEIHAINGPHYNIEGMGVKFVASPRHADMLLVTGPVSRNLEVALKRAYDATPEPKWVVAMGDCGCTGGMFGESYATCGKVSNVIPVDVEVPGCPPTPIALLQGILAAVSKGRTTA